MRPFLARSGIVTLLLLLPALPGPAAAAPAGTLTWGLHVTLAARWLDPGDTEAFINPFMVLYAIHDALVKPMPAGDNTPSLAESWTVSKDGLTYEFETPPATLRRPGWYAFRALVPAAPGQPAVETPCAAASEIVRVEAQPAVSTSISAQT